MFFSIRRLLAVFAAGCFLCSNFAGQLAIEVSIPLHPPYGEEFGLHRLPASSPHPGLVAFSSYSSALAENDTNGLPDIFLWVNETPRLITVGTNGAANGASFDPALSKDGKFVAFISSASNFVPDTNKVEDVFIATVATGEIELVSVPARTTGATISGTRNTVISEDGRFVAFTTTRSDLRADLTTGRQHLLVRDREAAETIWANLTLEGAAISAKPVAIMESKLWFLAGTNLYRFDLTNRTMTPFSRTSTEPAFSNDGSKVALQIVTSVANDLRLIDIATLQFQQLYSSSSNRFARYDSPSVSDDGAVAFMASAGADTDRISDVFVAGPGEGAPLKWVSSIPTPADSTLTASSPIISPDGRLVYFKVSITSKINRTRRSEVYVRDLTASAPELVAAGAYFSKMVRTPSGPVVLSGAGDIPFTFPSDETDMVFLPFPEPPPSVALRITGTPGAWKISFAKVPGGTPKLQAADSLTPNAWADLSIAPEDTGSDWVITDAAELAQRFYRLLVSP